MQDADDAVPVTLAEMEDRGTIVELFEQTHTEPVLYAPGAVRVGFDQSIDAWLDPATGLRP